MRKLGPAKGTCHLSRAMPDVASAHPTQAVAARLEALENDNAGEDPFAADSGDEEFVLRDDSDEGGGLAVLACQLALKCYR